MTPEDIESLDDEWDVAVMISVGSLFSRTFRETYSAMANTDGGYIVLGVQERADRSFEIVGVSHVERVEANLWKFLNQPQNVSANVLRPQDVERHEVAGKSVLVIHVPRAPRNQRPVRIGFGGEMSEFERIREHNEWRRLKPRLGDGFNDDSQSMPELGIASLEPASVEKYFELFRTARGANALLFPTEVSVLVQTGALTPSLTPTRAGLMMLGKASEIARIQSHGSLKFSELSACHAEKWQWIDRLCFEGTESTNLLEFYLKCQARFEAAPMPPREVATTEHTVAHSLVVAALCEALLNTLVHADYSRKTGIRVLRSGEGFEFISPGKLLVSAHQVWTGGTSEPRNSVLQRMFGFLNLGQGTGAGGPRMRQTWRQQQWRAPRIWHDDTKGEVHLEMRQEGLLPPICVAKLTERFGDAFTSLDELGRVLLVSAALEGSITLTRARELTDHSTYDLKRKLAELFSKQLLTTHRVWKHSSYTLQSPSFCRQDAEVIEISSHLDDVLTPQDIATPPRARTPQDAKGFRVAQGQNPSDTPQHANARIKADGDDAPQDATRSSAPQEGERPHAIPDTDDSDTPQDIKCSDIPQDAISPQEEDDWTPQDAVTRLVALMAQWPSEWCRRDLQEKLDIHNRKDFRRRFLGPALKAGFIEMTEPGNSTSRYQRYRLTPLGWKIIDRFL